MRLKDKVVLVTASTRGIGLAIVKACAKPRFIWRLEIWKRPGRRQIG